MMMLFPPSVSGRFRIFVEYCNFSIYGINCRLCRNSCQKAQIPLDEFSFSWEYATDASFERRRSDQYVYGEGFDNPKLGAYEYVARANDKWHDAFYAHYLVARHSLLQQLNLL